MLQSDVVCNQVSGICTPLELEDPMSPKKNEDVIERFIDRIYLCTTLVVLTYPISTYSTMRIGKFYFNTLSPSRLFQ